MSTVIDSTATSTKCASYSTNFSPLYSRIPDPAEFPLSPTTYKSTIEYVHDGSPSSHLSVHPLLKESPSPASSEFPSVLSDKCSSKGNSGDSSSGGVLTDNERSIDDCSPPFTTTTSSYHACDSIQSSKKLLFANRSVSAFSTSLDATNGQINGGSPSRIYASPTKAHTRVNSVVGTCCSFPPPTGPNHVIPVISRQCTTSLCVHTINTKDVAAKRLTQPATDLCCLSAVISSSAWNDHPAFRDSTTKTSCHTRRPEYTSIRDNYIFSCLSINGLNNTKLSRFSPFRPDSRLGDEFQLPASIDARSKYESVRYPFEMTHKSIPGCGPRRRAPPSMAIKGCNNSTSPSDVSTASSGEPHADDNRATDATVPRKRRSQTNTHPRVPKRRRNLDRSDTSADSSPSLSLRFLRDEQPRRFQLHEPYVYLPAQVYPPTPLPINCSPEFEHPRANCTSGVQSPRPITNKYASFPFCLSSARQVTSSESDVLSELTKLFNQRVDDRLLRENFLLNALKQASLRTNHLHFHRSSPSPNTPCQLLSDNFSPSKSFRSTTPPLTGVHSQRRATTNLRHVLPSKSSRYPELSVLSNSWSTKQPGVCPHCAMPIIDNELSIEWNSSDADGKKVFCSYVCLESHYNTMQPTKSNASMISKYPYFTDTVVPLMGNVPVLLVSQPVVSKPMKGPYKRLFSTDKSHRRKRSDSDFASAGFQLQRSAPWRWCSSRWRRFSKVVFRKLISDSEVSLTCRNSSHHCNSADAGDESRADFRQCLLCGQAGDAPDTGAGRLLLYTHTQWLHLNCALWCYDAYETLSGGLVNIPRALKKASLTPCSHCRKYGAGLPCFHPDCPDVYHVPCALSLQCSFHADRSMYCPQHSSECSLSAKLASLAAPRRIFISQDDNRELADSILENRLGKFCSPMVGGTRLRSGGLILHNVGQLLLDRFPASLFHSAHFVYPVGYHSTRIYWSYRHPNRRCSYHCRIEAPTSSSDVDSSVTTQLQFVVTTEEIGESVEVFVDSSCNGVWRQIIERINYIRQSSKFYRLRIVTQDTLGETLYGLNEPHVVRIIESLPGIERLINYALKFGPHKLIEDIPLAINLTGCARSEPKLWTNRRRSASELCNIQHPSFIRTTIGARHLCNSRSLPGGASYNSPTSVSKSQQYRRLRSEWKANVLLGRSRIQGLGLYAARDISKHVYIIEYLGELIRNEVGNKRERVYESQNRGVYMFRVDDDIIVDATMCGGLARYINHSCEPNCTAEILTCDGGSHIIIIANRDILQGEELTYDYKFDLEEDRGDRIPCLCGSSHCRRWMN